MNYKRGFTLIEMLVVIAIMAIVGSIYSQNELLKAKDASAKNLGKKISLVSDALQSYRTDNGSWPAPLSGGPVGVDPVLYSLTSGLAPSGKSYIPPSIAAVLSGADGSKLAIACPDSSIYNETLIGVPLVSILDPYKIPSASNLTQSGPASLSSAPCFIITNIYEDGPVLATPSYTTRGIVEKVYPYIAVNTNPANGKVIKNAPHGSASLKKYGKIIAIVPVPGQDSIVANFVKKSGDDMTGDLNMKKGPIAATPVAGVVFTNDANISTSAFRISSNAANVLRVTHRASAIDIPKSFFEFSLDPSGTMLETLTDTSIRITNSNVNDITIGKVGDFAININGSLTSGAISPEFGNNTSKSNDIAVDDVEFKYNSAQRLAPGLVASPITNTTTTAMLSDVAAEAKNSRLGNVRILDLAQFKVLGSHILVPMPNCLQSNNIASTYEPQIEITPVSLVVMSAGAGGYSGVAFEGIPNASGTAWDIEASFGNVSSNFVATPAFPSPQTLQNKYILDKLGPQTAVTAFVDFTKIKVATFCKDTF